jgi:hypothetical protein
VDRCRDTAQTRGGTVRGNHPTASQLFGAAEALRRILARRNDPHEQAIHDQCVAATRAALGEAAFAAAWEAGETTALGQSIENALGSVKALPAETEREFSGQNGISAYTCGYGVPLRKTKSASHERFEEEILMFNSTVLDVAIGLVFTFLAVSLAVSAIVEAIASAMKWRSSTLLSGIKDLLNDQDFSGLALAIYNHALVNPQDNGNAKTQKDLKHPPTYIQPKQFANALIDIARITQGSPDKIKATIDANITDKQLNGLLKGIVDRTTGDLEKMRDQIAGWFDNSMDRISGVYKRKTQFWSLVAALIIAATLNVSAINIGTALWVQPTLARTIAPSANLNPGDALKQLEGLNLPIGWSAESLAPFRAVAMTRKNVLSGLEILAGWFLTAVATLFGAPFWFDMLQQFVRLKGSGPSPAEKQSGAGAAA